MGKEEIWIPLMKEDELPAIIYTDKILYDEGILKILTFSEDGLKELSFKFDDSIGFRCHDEGRMLWVDYSDKNIFPWSFFEIENSKYLSWFHEMSYEIYLDQNLHHFMIFTDDDIIDIIAYSMPKVEVREKTENPSIE